LAPVQLVPRLVNCSRNSIRGVITFRRRCFVPLCENSAMPHQVEVRRRTRVADTIGGSKTLPVVIMQNVPAWVQSVGASEIMKWQQRGMSVTHKIYFPGPTDPGILSQDQIIITAKFGFVLAIPGHVLEVKSAPEPDSSSGLGYLWSCLAEDLTAREN
jgi:hypothetical protein